MRKMLLLSCAILAVVMAMSIGGASTASAGGIFCNPARVSLSVKCVGAAQKFYYGQAYGNETGVCVGYDSTAGTCAPVWQYAHFNSSYEVHSPWVYGTSAANSTLARGELLG